MPAFEKHLTNCNVTDRLTELPFEQWPLLNELFTENWPRDFLAFSSIKYAIKLKGNNKVPDTKILVLNNDWSDGTFILQDGLYTIIYSLGEEPYGRLRRALMVFDWSYGPMIHPYYGRFRSTLRSVYAELKLDILHDGPMDWFWMPAKKALTIKLEVPEDVYIAPMTPEHCSLANSMWPHRYPGSEVFLTNLSRNSVSRAVFGKENHDIRAWVLRKNNGIITSLHTHPDHRRKGYGSLVLMAISLANAEEGQDSVGCIIEGNDVSEKMFYKLGFQNNGPMYYAKTSPF